MLPRGTDVSNIAVQVPLPEDKPLTETTLAMEMVLADLGDGSQLWPYSLVTLDMTLVEPPAVEVMELAAEAPAASKADAPLEVFSFTMTVLLLAVLALGPKPRNLRPS